MLRTASPTFLFLALVLASALPAQNGSRGIFAGVPTVLSVDGDPSLPPGTMLFKPNGFTMAQPAPFAPPGQPSFDLRTILQAHGAPADLDVDDLSMGEDWILCDDQTGRILVPQNRWGAITFSVTRGSAGAPGSRIAAESAAGRGAAVFSYVLPGSLLPAPFVDAVERAHDAAELGLGALPGPEVDALDHLLPIFALEPGMRAMLPAVPELYFTIASADVGRVPATWWGGSTPSGATVFLMRWSSTGGWSPPRVWKLYREFGLVAAQDIDGLAIDLLNQRVLFSTRTPTVNPIRFLYYGNDQAIPTDYKKPDGTPVSTGIGLVTNDDVDAICSMDPSIRSRGGRPNAFFFLCGTPRAGALSPVPPLHGSAFRGYDPNGPAMVMDSWCIGFPPGTGQGPGFAALLLTFGDAQAPVFSVSPVLPRNPNNPVVGDPVHYGWRIPLNLSLLDTRVTLRWFAVDAGFTELAEAWPVQVRI